MKEQRAAGNKKGTHKITATGKTYSNMPVCQDVLSRLYQMIVEKLNALAIDQLMAAHATRSERSSNQHGCPLPFLFARRGGQIWIEDSSFQQHGGQNGI